MNPERWRRIDALLSAALERNEGERASFLARECQGDEELRKEVQRLLMAHGAAGGFLEAPPADESRTIGASEIGMNETASVGSRLEEAPDGAASSEARADPTARALVLGRYIVLNKLGGGGMGVVYAAYDPELDRKVALKLLRPDSVAELKSTDARAPLLREAQAMARVTHPNVISVHDVGTLGKEVFIAMELVDGRTLTRWLKEKERSARDVLQVFVQAGRGLAAAHAAGLVHRDFKPDNVLVGNDGRVKVLDFGLARAAEDLSGVAPTLPVQLEASGGSTPRALEAQLTKSGAFMGTPAYMAPEQLLGKPTDARTDQFSFCVALYEALYGERPFHGDSVEALAQEVTAGKLKETEKPARVPGSVRQILRRGLRPNPDERYPSMDSLVHELSKDPRATRRRALALGGAVLGLATIGIGYREMVNRQSQVCKGAERKLAGVWDGERKAAVSAAFLATAKPYAADAVRAVERALDTYAQGWTSMHTDACEATRLRGEQSEELLDLRMECLSDRRHELKSLVDIFLRKDPSVVERAPQAALGLSGLSGCADAAALRAPVKPPADPAARAKVDELRKKLAEASALEVAGKYSEGLPIAKAAAAEANQLQYRPIEAEALSRLAALQDRTGDVKTSEQTFHDSVIAALAGRHDEALARAWIYLVAVGHELSHYERGHEAGRYAFAVLERLGQADELRGRLFNNLGLLLESRSRNHGCL